MISVYILYSPSIEKFYVGQTKDVRERLILHNSGEFKTAFTTRASDWELQISIEFESRIEALKCESYIKSMKSKKWIKKLIEETTLQKELKKKFSDR